MKISRQLKYPGSDVSVMENAVPGTNGTWGSLKLTIFLNTVMVGEYLRNYPSLGLETFYPFRSASGQLYALYCAHYSTIRVLKITDTGIEDWCGQDVGTTSFCPGELYVPQYFEDDGEVTVDNEYDDYSDFVEMARTYGAGPNIRYADFGFMAGCDWGDDMFFKLRYLDLRNVDSKELVVSDHYGNLELPNNMPLKKCITFTGSLDHVTIAAIQLHRTHNGR